MGMAYSVSGFEIWLSKAETFGQFRRGVFSVVSDLPMLFKGSRQNMGPPKFIKIKTMSLLLV